MTVTGFEDLIWFVASLCVVPKAHKGTFLLWMSWNR